MKKTVFFIIFIAITTLTLNAQNRVGWIAKFGAAGGFTPVWTMPDMGELNNYVQNFGLEGLSENGMLGYGGSGYAYIMFIKNVRIGGMGFGSSATTDGMVNGFRHSVDYSIGAGAFTIEYTMPFIRNVAVSVGAMIGGGSVEIDMYKNRGEFTFDGVWNELDGETENISRSLSSSFFTISPTLNIDVPVTRFIALRIGGGYLWSMNGDWKVADNRDLNNVPDGINGNAFFIQTGVFLGFFAF